MASGSSSTKGKSKVGESQPAETDIFSFLQSSKMDYGFDIDELKINPEEEAQVNIPIQRSETRVGNRSETRVGNRDEEDTAAASQN